MVFYIECMQILDAKHAYFSMVNYYSNQFGKYACELFYDEN